MSPIDYTLISHHGAFNRSAIVTLVERATRYTLLGDLPDGHGAEEVYAC